MKMGFLLKTSLKDFLKDLRVYRKFKVERICISYVQVLLKKPKSVLIDVNNKFGLVKPEYGVFYKRFEHHRN